MPFGLENFFKVYFATAISHCLCIVDVGFHVRVVDNFSGIDVNDNLHLRKKKQLFFSHDFTYVFDLGLLSTSVLDAGTSLGREGERESTLIVYYSRIKI